MRKLQERRWVSLSSKPSHFLKMFPVAWEANKYLHCQHPDTASDPVLCGHFLTLVGSSTYWHWNLFKSKVPDSWASRRQSLQKCSLAHCVDSRLYWLFPLNNLMPRAPRGAWGRKVAGFSLETTCCQSVCHHLGQQVLHKIKRKIVRESFSFPCHFLTIHWWWDLVVMKVQFTLTR